MKKRRAYLVALATLFVVGCSTEEDTANRESIIDQVVTPSVWEQHVIVDDDERVEKVKDEVSSKCSDTGDSLNQESVESHLGHSSEWFPYMDIDFFGEDYEKANSHDFMNSGGQYIHQSVYYALSSILYDYSQQINQNLLLDYWVVERVTPIGNDYYNALFHQRSNGVRADLLFSPTEMEYKVLYVICDDGQRISYNGLSYISQYDWMPYNWEETSSTIDRIDNPFFEIYESSIGMELASAVAAYENEVGYIGKWKVQEIYAYNTLNNYLLISEDRVVWFCLDVAASVKEYTAETFYIK